VLNENFFINVVTSHMIAFRGVVLGGTRYNFIVTVKLMYSPKAIVYSFISTEGIGTRFGDFYNFLMF
jgi:hypothetical protein